MKIVLSIAGSDPSGGAGIQQDIKTMTAIGVYGAAVITALTSQNTLGVQGVMAVPADVVSSQLTSVLSDLEVSAIKIGQVPDAEVAHAIASTLLTHYGDVSHCPPIIYDPVMISTSGRRLMTPDTIEVVEKELFPLCYLLTPNMPEASQLTGLPLRTDADIIKVGKVLTSNLQHAVLIKGGHAEGSEMCDRLFRPDEAVMRFNTARVESSNLHGTGCTLSSAIASYLAKGNTLPHSIKLAKEFVTRAIETGKDLHIGNGNGPLNILF